MQISSSRHWARITHGILAFGIGCFLTFMPLPGNAQFPSKYPDYPAIAGKIPASILTKISAIHPGTTRAEFTKLFDYYQHGVKSVPIDSDTAGKLNWVFHYVYRFAYVPRLEDPSDFFGFKSVILMKKHPDTVHWQFLDSHSNANSAAGILVIVDVTWKYARASRLNDFIHSDGMIGNPDDVITRVSKPYLIFECGISA